MAKTYGVDLRERVIAAYPSAGGRLGLILLPL
jgi:hypothetical protein